jgi:hypothetical protein
MGSNDYNSAKTNPDEHRWLLSNSAARRAANINAGFPTH